MSNQFGLLSVKNAELLAGLSRLVQMGNELTAEVLAHLAELEERRLHLQLGYSSVEELGMSEGSAGRRVAAARVCRRFPRAFELVARGELHLSALCGLAPHLDSQNASELLTACCRKTRRQVDELLAARFPKPDVREQIRRLPVRGQATAASDDPRIPDHTDTREEALAKASVNGRGHQATLVETTQISENCESATAKKSSTDGLPPAPVPPVPASPPLRRREVEALSADRFGVHFTADSELRELLERARALASHRLPKNDLSGLMRLVLASFVKHEEARRFAVGRKPRRAQADSTPVSVSSAHGTPPGGVSNPGKRTRHVPAAVRREVYLRDQGQCSFVSEDGRRCNARAPLELDHVDPWARLGDAGVSNIRLRCRAHNQLHARECFGARHIEAKVATHAASHSRHER